MSSVIIGGDISGSCTLQAPAVSGSSVLTLPVATDTLVGKATTDTLTNKSIAVTQLTGTLAVANGGTGVVTSTGTGNVVLSTSPNLTTPALGTVASGDISACTGTANSLNAGIGVNQTWTNVTASRALATSYTNSTGKPIQISIACTNTTLTPLVVTTGGVSIKGSSSSTASYHYAAISLIIPNGNTYSLACVGASNINWNELR